MSVLGGLEGIAAAAPSMSGISGFMFGTPLGWGLFSILPAMLLRGKGQMLHGMCLGNFAFSMGRNILPSLGVLVTYLTGYTDTSLAAMPGSPLAVVGYLGSAFIWNICMEQIFKARDLADHKQAEEKHQRREVNLSMTKDFFNYIPIAVLCADVLQFFEHTRILQSMHYLSRTSNYLMLGGVIYFGAKAAEKFAVNVLHIDKEKLLDIFDPIKDFTKWLQPSTPSKFPEGHNPG